MHENALINWEPLTKYMEMSQSRYRTSFRLPLTIHNLPVPMSKITDHAIPWQGILLVFSSSLDGLSLCWVFKEIFVCPSVFLP